MGKSVIPQSYKEWRHCIVVDCGLELTPSFIDKRISALKDKSEYHTKQFIRLYGQQYYQQVLGWFMQAREAA